jgi:hypothetical protein
VNSIAPLRSSVTDAGDRIVCSVRQACEDAVPCDIPHGHGVSGHGREFMDQVDFKADNIAVLIDEFQWRPCTVRGEYIGILFFISIGKKREQAQ